MKRLALGASIIVATIAVAVAAAAAFGVLDSRACTLVGCSDGVRVGLKLAPASDDARFVRACTLGKCARAEATFSRKDQTRLGLVTLPCPELDAETTADLTVEVLGAGGSVLGRRTKEIAVERFQPNGPDCDGTCYTGHAGFDVAARDFIRFANLRAVLASDAERRTKERSASR